MSELLQLMRELIAAVRERPANYYDGYRGVGHSSAMPVVANSKFRLPAHPCKFVRLILWNATDDEVFTLLTSSSDQLENSNSEVYYGFESSFSSQLFVGKPTELLPVNNTNQITIRVPQKLAASTTLKYEWFT